MLTRDAKASKSCSLASAMHLVQCHVKGYSISCPIGWWNGFTTISLVVVNTFSHTTRYLARSQTTVVYFKVLLFPLSFFTLHTSHPFSESLASVLRHADDVVIGHPCRVPQGISIINNALKYASEWSSENGLNLNPNKYVQCMFSLKGNACTDPELKATINDNAQSTGESLTSPRVTIARKTNHAEGIFRKCVRLPFIAKKLRRLSTPAEFKSKFDDVCTIPIIHYCSSAIFPGLLKQDSAPLKR